MPDSKVITVSSEQAHQLIKNEKNLLIIDVRTLEEYRYGHLKGAMLYPVQLLPQKILGLGKYRRNPILVYCASGGRSPSAVKILINGGFTNIYHMYQGISSWHYSLER
ncbi:MAG TPA: rhodanese-like domain-containing protein [Clostridiaceae bacterium]